MIVRRCPTSWLAVMVLMIGGGDQLFPRAHAQPGPPPAPTACPRPPHTCPPPAAIFNWVQINLKPDGTGCKLDPRTITDLELEVEDDVRWDFCSECPVDMVVELDTTDPDGPFDNFDSFIPPPPASNEVSALVSCNGFASFTGKRALEGGSWKYSIHATPRTGGSLPDVIDPRLEIDDYGRFTWLLPLLASLFGLGIGLWFGRRRRGASV